MRRENVEVRAIDSGASEVFLNCIRRRIVELAGCELVRLNIADAHATNKSVYLHELGHMYNGGAWAAAGDNGGRAIAWLYFAELIEGGTGCAIHELYADAIMVATQSTATPTYYNGCSETGSSPSAATLTMMGSVLKNEIPSWFNGNYTFADGDPVPYDTSTLNDYSHSYDLEQFWTDLFDIPTWQFAAVAALRDAFGGYCRNSYASFAASDSSYLRNPWRAGGCTPHAPTVSLDTAGVVTWTAPPYDGGRAITQYVVEWKDYGQSYHRSRRAVVTAGSALTYTTVSTSAGSGVRVAAQSLFGVGTFSEASQPPVVPGKPAVSAVIAGDGELTVQWSAPASSGGADITSYDVRSILTSAMDKADANWDEVIGAWTEDALESTITSLTNGKSYDVEVRAVNSAGDGGWSTSGMVGTPASADSTLSALSVDGARLSPTFMSDVTSYTASVGYTVTQITVTASENDAGAAATLESPADSDPVTSGFQVNLSEGPNDITIKVTAENGSTSTYTVTVTRKEQVTSLTPAASDPGAPFPSEADYTLTFQGAWTSAVTPDGVPGGAHFSRLVGAVHNAGVSFLASGATASPGVESMAEEGTIGTLQSEVQTAIDAATALSVFQGSTDTGGVKAPQTLNPTLSSAHPRVTLVTMVAPSPDWFVGVSGLPLLNASGRWLRSHSVSLYPWDAGTEGGTDFSRSNAATSPPENIASIRGTGKFSTDAIASLSFELDHVTTTRSVAENTPAGTSLGAPITAVATSGSVTYSLGGADSSSFQIASSSGQLRTMAALDFETKNSCEVTVTDSSSSVDTVVTIDVTNRDERPTLTLLPRQPQVAAALTATLTDPDIIQTAAWKWERSLSSSGGWELITGATSSSYTPAATDEGYYLRVTVTYTDGYSAGKSRSVVAENRVEPENTAPTFPTSSTTRELPENSRHRDPVGQPVRATDLEDSLLEHSLAGNDASSFTINNVSGQIRVAEGAQLDYETADTLNIIVKATDSRDAEASIDVTIEITDVNEQPDAMNDVAETDEDMSVTIDVLTNDFDPENRFDPANRSLTVQVRAEPGSGVVTVETDGRIKYTPDANFNGDDEFRYRVTDDGNLHDEASVKVTIVPINDAPVFPSATVSRSVVKTAAARDPVGAPVEAINVDTDDTLTYSLEGADALAFDIDDFGQITIAPGTILDITVKDMYEVTVVAIDEAGSSARADVTITLTDRPVNQPPVAVGGGGGGGGPTPSDLDFEWTVSRDIEELDSGHGTPTGMWSDGATLSLLENGDGADDAVYAYDLESGERVEDAEFALAEQNRAPRGLWSDGETVWVSDSGRDRLFAYDLASGRRDEERELELPRDNRDPRGIWSEGETMWVLDGRADALFAYDLETGELLGEYELASANSDPRGIWSDGVGVWVSDHGAKRLFAYRLPAAPDAPAAEDAEPGRAGARPRRGVRQALARQQQQPARHLVRRRGHVRRRRQRRQGLQLQHARRDRRAPHLAHAERRRDRRVRPGDGRLRRRRRRGRDADHRRGRGGAVRRDRRHRLAGCRPGHRGPPGRGRGRL